MKINTKIRRYSKKKQRLYNRARSTGLADDMLKYKQFKHFMQAECCRAYNDYIASSFTTSSPIPKDYGHTYIKSKRKDHCGVGPLKQGFTTYTDSLEKANILNQYFSSVFIIEDNLKPPTIDHTEIPDMLQKCYQILNLTSHLVQMVFLPFS